MPSPISHSILTMSFYPLVKSDSRKNNKILIFLLIFIAVFPDLDFIPGLIMGDLLKFHRVYTHSIFGLVFFSAVSLAVMTLTNPENKTKILIVIILAYFSHLFLDLFGLDTNPENGIGIQILYPFTENAYIFPVQIFRLELFKDGKIVKDLYSVKIFFDFMVEILICLIFGLGLFKLNSRFSKNRKT
ncbi:metal-dependent hydrolase [candidate division KSB1 bacterium]